MGTLLKLQTFLASEDISGKSGKTFFVLIKGLCFFLPVSLYSILLTLLCNITLLLYPHHSKPSVCEASSGIHKASFDLNWSLQQNTKYFC